MRGPGGSSRLRFFDSGTRSEREPRTSPSQSPPAIAQQCPDQPSKYPHTCFACVRPVVVIAFLDDIEFRATGQGDAGPAGDSFGGDVLGGSPVPTWSEGVAGPLPRSC